MTSSKKDCIDYYSKHDVFIETDGSQTETKLEQEIHSVQCIKYCKMDPKVCARFFKKQKLKQFLEETCPFLGPLIPLFWTSGEVVF